MIMDLYGSGEVADQIYRAARLACTRFGKMKLSTCGFGVMKSIKILKNKNIKNLN